MRYTGIIDSPDLTHAVFVGFDEQWEGEVLLTTFAEEHPQLDLRMMVGEPGDPDDSARFIVTTNETGGTDWRVPSPDERIFA